MLRKSHSASSFAWLGSERSSWRQGEHHSFYRDTAQPTTTIMPDHSRASKRRRNGHSQIGAPSEADDAITPVNLPSSSAFSTRIARSNHVLPLTAICSRVFVDNFPTFSRDPRQWEPRKVWGMVGAQLERLPDSTMQVLFAMLSASCPNLLSHDLVKEVRMVN